MRLYKTKIWISSLILLLLLSGCAVKQPAEYAQQDPWEGYNRSMFEFNNNVDQFILMPLAKTYRTITPDPVKTGVRNFYGNLNDLPISINNLLQGKVSAAGSDLLRIIVNTTFGIGGIFDVASKFGLPKHEEDLGQTLAVWGVGSGPYFVAPLLGASTVRDFPAQLVSYVFNPLSYIGDSDTRLALRVTNVIQQREAFLDQEKIVRKWSPDFYVSLRGYYLSRRASLVADGMVDAGYSDEELE